MSLETTICEAISTIVDQSIAEAGYDKTIQGKIAGVVDETIGSYKVSYQDSTFLAYSTSSEVTYTTGSTVYVLIPSGDFSNDKTILGTVQKLGINYVVTAEGTSAYDINGVNVLSADDSFELCSYGGDQAIVLYSKDNSDSDNLITVDDTAIEQYIKTSDTLVCEMDVQTSIPIENQYRGNYGIIYALDFEDNATGAEITRFYTIDVDKMVSNPYKLVNKVHQSGIFNIDCENFLQVNYISLFCTDFPNTKSGQDADIFISGVSMCGATALSSEDLSNYVVTFSTPQGSYFTASNSDEDELTLTAQVRVKGSLVDNDSQSLSYYWFTENAGINSQSVYYNSYGGQGWKCLNDYTVVDSENNTVEWISGSYQWKVKKSDIIAESVTYKCAVVYDGTVITNTITVHNLDSQYEITIESDSGEQFYYDIGRPTLTCYVNGEEKTNYTYAWSMTSYDGTYNSLSETEEENEEYNETKQAYDDLVAAIESEEAWAAASQEELDEYLEILEEYEKIQRVEDNHIHKIDLSSITSFATFTCTVYLESIYLGTASIVISNSLETEGSYSLVINNGSALYKYDEDGVSPTSSAVENPIETKALSFSVYNNLGECLDDEITGLCEITWTVPTTDTLLSIPSTYTPIDSTDTTVTYGNISTLVYSIASKYDIKKTNNDIILQVNYKDLSLSATTNFTFIKEGESGTNGTEYTCKLIPNTSSLDVPDYPVYFVDSSNNVTYNYSFGNNKPLKVQIWHNDENVFTGLESGTSSEGSTVEINWDILRNQYSSSIVDQSSFTIWNSNEGSFKYNGFNLAHPANILKATVTYDGIDYYTTMPVTTVKVFDDDFQISLKDNTGFHYGIYTSDGQSAKWDNSNPFEIVIKRYINGYWEDISIITKDGYSVSYNWDLLGRVYDYVEGEWVLQPALKINSDSSLDDNQKSIKPANDFDGQCVTNSILVTVYSSDTLSIDNTIQTLKNIQKNMTFQQGYQPLFSGIIEDAEDAYDDNETYTVSKENIERLKTQLGIPESLIDMCFEEHSSSEGEYILTDGPKIIGFIDIPIHLFLNRYGLSALNSWDGNSVTIDEEGGFILSPQMGAGRKEDDNSFTGVLIGTVKESNETSEEVGLFGYSSGQRSIFLDAEKGSATFGVNGKGQIVLDPTDIDDTGGYRALITSGSYEYKADGTGQGMEIDFTTPTIKFGSGNFEVSEEGYITAKGGGTIAGWYIDDNNLWSGNTNVDSSSNVRIASADFTRTVNGQKDETLRMAFSNNFGVNSSGTMYAAQGIIGSGSASKITLGKDSTGKQSAIYSGSKNGLTISSSGFYVGTDGIALGTTFTYTDSDSTSQTRSQFQVTSDGTLYAKKGYIGNGYQGWTIGNNYLKNGKSQYDGTANNGVYIGTDGIGLGKGTFYVSSSGKLHSTSGDIGGWTIGSTYLKNGKDTYDDDNNGVYLGADGIGLGKGTFYVTKAGKLHSTSGTIGGWTINSSTLVGGDLTLNSNGSITGPTWSITKAGKATFNNVKITNEEVDSDGNSTGSTSNSTIDFGSNFKVDSDGNLTCKSATIKGTIESGSTIEGSEIVGGSISIGPNNQKTYYLKMGDDTKHPEVSGLNVTGDGGIDMGATGISACTNIGRGGAVFTFYTKNDTDNPLSSLSSPVIATSAILQVSGSAYLYIGNRTLSEYVNDVCKEYLDS